MQFVTFGNRIATENFNIGFFYKITFTDSTEVECTCIGIGANFVSFQRQEPELLFTLTLDNAATVLSIDFLGGGGTSDYEELDNKPKINNVELIGNKSLSDLGIQPTISDLDTIRSGAAAGATAVQPAALADYQPIIDSSHKLDADLVDDTSSTNKFATAAQISQIETNKNNISSIKTWVKSDNALNTNDGRVTINFDSTTSTVYIFTNNDLKMVIIQVNLIATATIAGGTPAIPIGIMPDINHLPSVPISSTCINPATGDEMTGVRLFKNTNNAYIALFIGNEIVSGQNITCQMIYKCD